MMLRPRTGIEVLGGHAAPLTEHLIAFEWLLQEIHGAFGGIYSIQSKLRVRTVSGPVHSKCPGLTRGRRASHEVHPLSLVSLVAIVSDRIESIV